MESWLATLLAQPDVAQSFAAAGTPPPPLPSIGQSLEPGGMGVDVGRQDIAMAGKPGGVDATSAINPMLQSLRGVTAPPPPRPQELGTPAVPRPTGRIDAGGLMQLLAAMAPRAAPQAGPALPSSLLQAIGGR